MGNSFPELRPLSKLVVRHTWMRGTDHAAERVKLFLEEDWSISTGQLLRQLHLNWENVVSGKLFETISLQQVYLLFCLFGGQKAEMQRVITWWKAKKHFHIWLLTLICIILHSTSTYGIYYYWGNVFLMRKTEQYLREKMFKPMLICSRSNKIF